MKIFWDVTPCSPIGAELSLLLLSCSLLTKRIFDAEDGGSMLLRNVSEILLDYTLSYPAS
jgi:hypothetical protein